ncbi:ubiquitin carboxyl-terminal hydrolase 2-like [Pelmatolapia mariae]|uniref:ubiquitin carboxyl-terminal hydrolase 2-like n=1 Tax=Pelmatolapia mariae TaxID=158779 RepID=UPI002FE61F8C
MRGLINSGFRCATNSVLQCLHATDELRAALHGIGPNDARSNAASKLECTFINMDDKEQAAPYDPKSLVEVLSEYSGMWDEVKQDASDVLRCVLNALADDEDPVCKDAADLWAIPKRHSAACSECKSENVSYDTAMDVNVYLSEKPKDLQDYVNGYSESFSVPDIYCDKCNALTKLTVTTDITELPKLLCFNVLRAQRSVENGDGLIVKNNAVFNVSEELDCSRMSEDARVSKYELYGVITHTGPCLFGHYAAFVKRMSQWYHVDDENVKMCSALALSCPDTLSSLYMLMYRQIDSPPS